jgi:hypothetical protein
MKQNQSFILLFFTASLAFIIRSRAADLLISDFTRTKPL